MSKSLDTDQALQNVGPNLDANCLQRLSADDKIVHYNGKILFALILYVRVNNFSEIAADKVSFSMIQHSYSAGDEV